MHQPPQFQLTDVKTIHEFIENNGFAILVSQQSGQLLATHIPLIMSELADGRQVLQGHIGKANPQWKQWTSGEEVLAIFSGPHAYVSSSWYDHLNVPTWNYIAAHIYGKLRIIEGEELVQSMQVLVDKYEKGRENRFHTSDLSPQRMKRELRGIVGFEIEITRVEAAQKLSQNRNEKDYQNIIAELEKEEDTAAKEVAKEMKKRT